MFLPLKTEAHDGKIRLGSIAILAICLLVHILVTLDDGEPSLMYRLALVNGDFRLINLITHQFTHGDWMHLFFNLWFFYIVGITMEKYWGSGRFLGIYLGCGVLAALGFIFLSGVKSAGIPLAGGFGAIAGMMGAFARTHGDAKVQILWIWAFRFRSFQVPAKWYLGFWLAGQVVDAVLHSGQQGGVAFTAHVVGFVAGLAAAGVVRGDGFYAEAYQPSFTSEDVDRISGPDKLEGPKPEAPASRHQDGTDVTTLLNRGLHAAEHGDSKGAGEALFLAMEKALSSPGIPGLPASLIQDTVQRVLAAASSADLPPGALYAWARKLEQNDWWEWAIAYYDVAAADFSPGTGSHSRNNSLLRAACLRLDHGREKDLALAGLRRVLENDAQGPLAAEAGTRLAEAGVTLPRPAAASSPPPRDPPRPWGRDSASPPRRD